MNFSFMSDGFRSDYRRSKGTTFYVKEFLRNELKSWRSSKLAGKLTELQDLHQLQGQTQKFLSAMKLSVVLNLSCVGLIEIDNLSFSKTRIKNDRCCGFFLLLLLIIKIALNFGLHCELNDRIQARYNNFLLKFIKVRVERKRTINVQSRKKIIIKPATNESIKGKAASTF